MIKLDSRFNFLVGANASGKSSFVEACLMALTGRSFRTRQLKASIAFDASFLQVQATTFNNYRILLECFRQGSSSKRIKVNEQLVRSASQLAAICPVQLISPESFNLVDSAPSERRRFLDWLLFHVEHSFQSVWLEYETALKQRNALLRSGRTDKQVFDELTGWDQALVLAETRITSLREYWLRELSSQLKSLLNETDFDSESFDLQYKRGYTMDRSFDEVLMESRLSDRQRGFTQYGCHKADMVIKYEDKWVKDCFSRGQKKLLICLMYLAQLRLLKSHTNKSSVFMIDDFSSELDIDNQQLLLSGLAREKDLQIIATGLAFDTAKAARKVYNNGHMFHVERGTISPVNE